MSFLSERTNNSQSFRNETLAIAYQEYVNILRFALLDIQSYD